MLNNDLCLEITVQTGDSFVIAIAFILMLIARTGAAIEAKTTRVRLISLWPLYHG